MYNATEYFSCRIPHTIFEEHPISKQQNYFRATPAVRFRFQRALYRLSGELDIMGKLRASPLHDHGGKRRPITFAEANKSPYVVTLSDLEDHRVLRAFHSHYSAVEIEQLCSVCSLLINEVAPGEHENCELYNGSNIFSFQQLPGTRH